MTGTQSRKVLLAGATALVTSGLLLKLAMMLLTNVDRAPVAFDSNYYLNIGSNYLERGGLTPYMWRIPPESAVISGSGSGYGIYVLLLWFRAAGLSLGAGQALMFGFGVLMLPLCYGLAREWWDDRLSGVAATVLVSLSAMFFIQFFIRMDAPAVCVAFAAVLLHLHAQKTRAPRLHALVGVVLVIGLEVHVLLSIWLLALGFVHASDYLVAARAERTLRVHAPMGWYVAGALPAAIAYAVVHVLPDPHAYFLIPRLASEGGHFGIVQELARVLRFVPFAPIESAVLGMSLVAAALRRSAEDRRFLQLAASFAVAIALLNPPVSVEYTAQALPVFAIGAGRFVAARAGEGASAALHRASLSIAVALVLLVLRGAEVREATRHEREPVAAVDYVRTHYPADTVVIGSPRLFHRMPEFGGFLSLSSTWESQVGAAFRDEPYEQFLARERPTVLIGSPEEGHPEVRAYVEEHGFREVVPDVWVDPSLDTSAGMQRH